ncbi:MAG: hypothetical protein QJR11_00830 [Fulvimonas sp.]|nr:hypothetical protein [Fulvimonas sp.]
MKPLRLACFAACLGTAAVYAQGTGQTLNLRLPADYPAASGTTAAQGAPVKAPAAATSSGAVTQAPSPYAKDPPGTWYGDTSGRLADTDTARAAPACDDATFNQPQLHGSVGMGVMGGNHVSGDYQAAGVTISQTFGHCGHPTGGMSISVGGTQGHYHVH